MGRVGWEGSYVFFNVSFDTILRVTQSIVRFSRLSAKRTEACVCDVVSFDTIRPADHSVHREFSRLSAKRTEACGY